MDKELMKLNLQFFADGEDVGTGAEDVDTAEPQPNTDTDTSGETNADSAGNDNEQVENNQTGADFKNEINAGFAAARRQAEAEIKARDARYAERFKNFKNPITGNAIKSEKDYFDALDAQDELARRQELQQHGIDPKTLDDLIARSPLMRQAQQIIQHSQEQETQNIINNDVAQIMKIDSSVKSLDDLVTQDNFNDVLDKIRNGYSLVDAYKIVNYEKLTQQSTQAAKQAAINAAKGKDHMTPSNGVTDNSKVMDIPAGELGRWRDMFPDASDKELKEKYTRAMKAIS